MVEFGHSVLHQLCTVLSLASLVIPRQTKHSTEFPLSELAKVSSYLLFIFLNLLRVFQAVSAEEEEDCD